MSHHPYFFNIITIFIITPNQKLKNKNKMSSFKLSSFFELPKSVKVLFSISSLYQNQFASPILVPACSTPLPSFPSLFLILGFDLYLVSQGN